MSASEDTIDISYLRHLKWDETVVTSGDRETPTLLYVTRGPKNDSLIWHFEENGKFFQYRQYTCNKKTVDLMCVYSRNTFSLANKHHLLAASLYCRSNKLSSVL